MTAEEDRLHDITHWWCPSCPQTLPSTPKSPGILQLYFGDLIASSWPCYLLDYCPYFLVSSPPYKGGVSYRCNRQARLGSTRMNVERAPAWFEILLFLLFMYLELVISLWRVLLPNGQTMLCTHPACILWTLICSILCGLLWPFV